MTRRLITRCMSLAPHIATLVTVFGLSTATLAKNKAAAKVPPKKDPWEQFNGLRQAYRLGQLGDGQMWAATNQLADNLAPLNPSRRAAVLQTQAHLLEKAGFPVLSALYAAQAIRTNKNPVDSSVARSWEILSETSTKAPIQNLLEELSASVNADSRHVPFFGSDWNYYKGSAQARKNDTGDAFATYQNVTVKDRHYLAARYQQAMMLYEKDKPEEASKMLRTVLQSVKTNDATLTANVQNALRDYVNLALARIAYEQRRFPESIQYYRSIAKESPVFYESLREQAWALFLAGYPNHALGAIYGATSPFFKDRFNPEGKMLASIIYYWMCRYEDSRGELADFMEMHGDSVENLAKFLDRKQLSDQTAYQLFEDVVTGVSGDSLGIPRNVLLTAAGRDTMLQVRDQYASVISETQRLDAKGVFGNRERLGGPRNYLDKWSNALRHDLGKKYITELRAMKEDFQRLYEQAQFLYVELLMSEKDQILGKELHANSKMDRVPTKDNIRGWGKKTIGWAGSDKNEYWWDELGYHIYQLEPLCQVKK